MYFVPLYLAHLGTIQSDIGRIAMSYALILVVIGPLVSHHLAHPEHRRYYVLAGGVITGAAMVIFELLSGHLVVLLMVAALGIAHALSLSSQAAMIAETELVRRLGAGIGMGVFRFWERIGSVAGPFVMAALIAAFGYENAVVILGISIGVSSLIYILLLRGIRSREVSLPLALGQEP
jgi:Na+/melibiose symporter-like transporter